MPTPDKIDQLYDALKADGAVSKSRENFRSYMLASGEQGYRNSKQLYDALKADGAVESATYEEFRDRLGLHAVKPQQPVAKPSSTPRSAQQPSKPQKAKQQPKKTAWKPTPAQQLQFQQTINGVQQTIQNVNERHKNMAEYSKQRIKHPFGQQGGWQPTWQEKMGMQMQLDETMRQVKQSQQDFNTRMENIRKGNTLGKTSEVKFNPESGKMERRYYTTHGDEVATPLEQSRLNLKYRDEWEATTEEGRRHREKRIQNDFERRVGASIDKYDPDNVAAMVWQQAEDKSNEEFGRYLDERSKPSWSNFLRGAAEGTSVTGGLGADNVDTGIKAFSTHLKYHDLQRMADDAWNMLGKEKQQSIIEDMYGALKNRYPQATEQQLQQAATEMAREQSDRRMYELAVAKNAPKDAAEYFIRKVAAGNAMGTLMQAAARAQAGTTGDWEAREDAEQRFEKQGHKVAGIAGTVTGFALDPLTWASAGAGGAAVKGTTWLGGKMIGEAAMRKFGTTLGGRMLGGAIGGAVNFGTYEAGSEALDQMKWGGYIDEETGERKDGFSFGNVAGRAGHGLMMGAVTGVIAPYLGNVSDKLVRATESTVGKMGIRAGELGVGTVAEGTIFAVPEIINTYGQYGDLINSLSDETSPNYIADEQERAAKIEELRNSRGDALMDVWTDNMAMIAGFKAQHLLKSAPRVIYNLARSKNVKVGFETRLRSILDGRGDLALTEDEKKELERRGYGDLKDLTEEYSRYAEAKEEYDKARPTTTDASRMIEGSDGQAELPYNRFVELMTDNSVSEAARAKMYYYLTGHGLPMSTVMGSSILEDKDADGNVTGYTVQSFGANGVITSRSFGDKKRADVEANRINRQAELNGFDVGERYYDWQGDNKRMYEACESVAEETGAPANLLFDLMKRKTEAMNEVELEWAEKILNAYNGLGDKYGSSEVRAAINDEFGIDVDKAIRKERNRRSEQEQKAVDEYANRLFADVKRKQEEAAERGEAPVDPDAPTSNSQIAALLGIDDGEQGDPVSAAFNRGHEADAQERQDIAIELAYPNNAEAQEAWNGVVQRINEDAAYMVAQQREQTKQMQHTDGSLRPAILKEKDSEGNDQQVYIVDGNVQMMPDGSMVDKASSDNIVVVYNPATGERKQIDPSADTGISSLGEVTTAEQREADIERSRQEYVQAQIDEAQGTVRFVPGQQLVLPTGEEAVVVATDADGENITVALGDGTQATVQRSELQRIRDEKAAADYRQRHGITEEPAAQQPKASTPAQPQADGRVAGAPADYTADMELTIRDEDGSEKPAMVMGRVRYENGSFVPDANGNIIEYFMDGEVKHDREDKLVDKVVSHVAPQQPEAAPVQEASAETPATVETTPPPVELQAEVAPQQVQEPVQTVEPQPTQPAEAPAQPTEQPTAEPMPVGEDGEEDWQATTPERAHAYIFNEAGLSRSEGNEFIAAQIQAVQSALVKAKSAQMPRVGTSIKKYNEAKAKRQEKIDEAQRVLDYWQQVRNIQNDIQREENERRAAEDAVRHDEAVAEAQAEYEARKQAEAERKAVGNENPMPAITEKWNNATKIDGHRDEVMLPDGTPLKGHYVLHESGASSPSHNPETWQKTDGFPMDANDNSVNDRDYERDHDAQDHTQSIARQYDQRALQSVPVVSNDGVVLSGNGRTMAGELAARDNTDGAYVNYLKEYAPKFGFTPEQVGAMQHPRVSFVPDEAMPYTAETFAKFNQQEMKSQNKTEQAVKLGKTVSDDSFKGIVRTINGYDTLGDFYNDAEASLGAVYDLHNAGVVPQAQLAEMVDGIRGQEKLSAVGREFLENMLIGKAFESDPEVVRMLTAEPAMRQTVITALGEIVDNIALGGDWSLQGELADAVKLCFDARQGGAKYGEIVSTYARQGVLFADPDELQTVADFNNATMLMLADVLNDKRVTLLKTTLQLYNNNARQSAMGQTDLFAGGIQSREDILRDVITFINENYGKRKEIEAARAAAVERRKAESVQQDGTPPAVSTDGEATAEPSAEPAPVEAEPVEATEPVEAEPNAVQTALAAAEQETQQTPFKTEQEAKDYLVSIGYAPDGLYMNNPKNEAQDYIDEANYQKEKRSEQPKEAPKNEQAQPKQEEKKAKSKWVDDADVERFEELRRRLRMKLGGQLNMGLDPEAFAIGVEMSYLMLKHGARKFGEFAKNLIEALGEGIRPYVKTLYNGARDLPEMADIEKDMTPWDEVRSFDVMNFDKEGAKDIVATAEHIVREQAAEREAKEATDKLKQERNEQRKETEQEVAANTEALASEAATVASEVESKLSSARSEREVNDLAKDIDDAIDKVNDQLALLGYYEAEPVESDFNEAYGYMRNAEKKAVKNVTELFKTLTKELGISDPVVYDTKGKKQKSVTANIAPTGGDVTMRFMLNRDKGVELYIDFMLEPDYENNRDNLVLKGIMFRPERNLPNGGRDYLRANNFFPVDVTMSQMLQGIRSVCQEWLPAEDYVAMAQRIAAENAGNQQEKPSKERKSKKKSVSLQEQAIPDLFSGLFSEDLKPTSNEQEVYVQPRTSTTERERGHQREQNEPLGESKQNEDERPDAGGVVRRSGNDTKSDTAGGSRVSEPSDGKRNVNPAKPEPAPLAESERKNTHNNHAERGTDYAPKGTSARIEANIKAIETMQRLIESGEPATPEDMSVLRKFSGWGGLGAAFKEKVSSGDSGYNPRLRDDYQPANPINARLRELLSPEAYEAANMSRNTAYYTPAPIIDAMWDVARAMGFRGGNVLEGSAGIGKVLGLMPTDMSERSNIQAIEVDETTGNILKLLYPDAKVDVKGFEKTYISNGSVDLAITNVPFGDILVKDETGDKDLSKKFRAIHDFCIAKNVRKLKEGGIGIFISTSGTLDSANSAKLRNWIVNEGNADVVGAFRMHKDTFGGAGVTSDIIVIRKRVNGRKSANAIDVSGTLPIRTVKYNTGETKRGSSEVIVKDLALDVNKHFVEHPEDMAGEMAFAFEKGDTYRATSKALYPSPSINQEQRLSEWAQQFKDMDWDKAEERESQQVVYEDLGEDVKEGSMLLDSDGNLCLAQRGKAVPINVNANKVKGHTKAECFNAYKAIKDALADVLEYQTTHSDDSGLQQRLAKLNKAYDSFVKTYGHLNKNTSISFLRSDMDYPSIAALESVSETGDKSGKRIVTYGKTDIFSRRVVETESEPKPTTIKDGIIASIYLNGRVDVPYIAEQLNMSDSDVRQQIIESGLGFENPTTTEMEVSYEYLSGNVREKLRQAQKNNTDGRYDANIKALERVIPMNIPAHLIEFTLGSSWVEPKLYEDFVKERTGLDVKLTNAGGTWIMSEPYYTNTEQNRAMGVISEKCDKTIYGHELIKAAITCKSISVTKTISTGYGSSKTTETIVDKEATMACANKIDEIRQDFKDWARGKMQGDPEMSERMERVYNELFNNSVPKEIPDEFVPEHFGGAATVVNGKPFKLRPHQAKAVIRATTQPLMLAHEVGTGKTYTLISTAMEMRRLGTARKPMIVVQNATVGQFVASAKALYPNAKILTLEDADRNAEGRRNFYAKIRYNDWDMIVVPQSVFERIPDSEERQIRFIEDKVEEKMMVLEKMREAANDDRDPVLRQAQRELDQLNDELNDLKLALQERKAGGKTEKDEKREAKTRQNAMVKAQEMLDRETDDVANFDDMGIDALLIDEAHEYKHLGFATAMQRGVKGVDPSYSKKSQGVYLKTQAVLENKNGKNVVFATGTPISNTAAEIWTFMRYLMPADTMREYGIYYFDDFVRNFGNIQQMLEFSTNGKYKENNRFAGYVNLPELVRIWAGVADTVLTREAGGVSDKIPKMDGEKAQDIYLPQTKALRGVMKFVKDQLDDYEKMSGKEKKENSHIPLVMYGIAKAAAVDARLVLEDAADEPNSKTNEAVRQTLRSLEDTKEYNGTVAIFADNYQNKATGFNLYEDIRKKLIDAGVPEAQVVVMKSGMSIKKKLEIFDKVNRGEVRVIMGSTFTLGTGVNIQERLHTLIHVDAPNRPMDYTQRNGRILRQGNLHNEWGIPVRVLRFGVEDSLDVTAYQRLKTKGAIADSIMEGKKMMSNSMENRVLEEEQDLFGDITAQLSGSQYALLKNQVEKEVKKLEARKKQWEADQTYVHNQKPRLKALIKDSEERAKRNKEALAKVEAAKNDGITIGKMKFPSLDAMGDYIKDYNSKQREQQEQVRTASGYQAEAKSDLTVSVGGFDFYIHRVITKEQKQEKGQLSLSFFSKTQMTYSCPELGLEDVPVDGQRLKSALEDILENVLSGDDFREKAEYADRAAERYKGELQQVEARDGKPFEYADELKQAKEKLAEYEELMKAEMAEKEAKYAEMDASVEAAKGVQLSDEDSDDVTEDTAKYRIREDEPPTKTGIGYKVFVLKDGKLYPPMVANPNGEATPVGVWLDADAAPVAGVTKTGRQQVKAGGKGTQGGSGKLAYRPGWHLGEIPYALQFNRMNPETGQRELFPANFVWAEVEYANDVDYQEEAMSYGMNASGKFQHSLAGLPRLPENGSYRYRTNPDPNTDPWVITGAMKVNRILKPSEVDAMVEAAGREPQQRQAGAITDEQVEALNAKVKRTMQEDRDMMRSAVQQMGEKLHTDINIIEDVNEITHPNAAVQERRRKSKGWYDTATGQVNIVLDNNKNIDDVKASVGHETIAHKGLRELVGEENYDEFLDETYQHLRDDLKKGVDDAAGRAFIDDTTKNGKRAKSYEQHRRTAVDELFGRMAEKPFEEFSEGERTLWQKIKATVRRLLDKFLGSLKLPKWFELGDNELRYILWRSKERLERGKEHPIDLARDIVKREELGLTDEARYNMGDAPETFKARQRRAVENRGTVMPGLNGAKFKVVEVPRHQYQGRDVLTQARDAAIDRYSSFGDGKKRELKSLHYDNLGATFDYVISPKSLTEAANHASDSDNIGVHAAVMDKLDKVINESIEIEEHPDIKKKDGERKWDNGFNKGILMHRFAAAVRIGDEIYRVKTTMKEYENPQKANGHYTYEVTKIEVLDEQSNTPNGRSNVSDVFVSGVKLLNNLEKSYDSGKKILDESKIADESTDLFRDPDETEDIWNDQSLGLQERITAAATRLANNHRDNKTLRNDAMRAIGGNLSDLRKAMSLQRTFDMTTVKRVADLARVLMNNGYLNGLTQLEVKRLLAAVKNSVGHNDIEGDVQKVMDIMVDNQLKHAEDTLHELEAIRGSKVDARGVEVQGQLDPAGAHTMKVFKKTRGWEKTDIEEAISEAQQRMGSSDVAVADEAALEYTGLQLALEYAENIKDSKVEERKLREEIKKAHDDASERDRATDSYRQYIASLQEAIRQNKIERAQSYFDLVGRLSDSLRESIANAKDFKEAEKQRIREIQHNANSDMEGRPSDEHYKPTFADKFVNNSFVSFLFAPLATFDQMLRMFGGKSANGEGYLYNRFMRGWIDARQQEINGVRDKYAILDAKAAELFGGNVKTWGDLIRSVGKLPKGTVSFWNGGEMQERELTQGNLMYIYMVNKMLDGRMKLRKMGITEENVADIEEVLDPRLIELADWLQDEFLVQTRNEYNETHKRMFGASMAAIEHYFPLKILANARVDKPEDLDNPDKSDGISTATGSIIKRRRNAIALDITGADALSVILDHVAQMEHWNAFAEFNRDINTLRTYKRFRNQVQNMTTIYGSGKELWKKFNDVCQMAAGTYRPPRTKLDEAAVNFAKGVTAAKVSFRMFTALKQFLSMPAYIPEARTDYLLRNIANPAGAWKWSMEHLPIFSERWRSHMSGDPRLLKSDMDWKMWRTRLMQLASRAGMSPNAFVDALTVSIGAHSMYQTRLAQYLRDGYSEADAEKKAVQDAEVLYNQTQQSSEGAFTSTMQVDRSWLSVLFTVFRNSSMSYQRQLHDALRNFKHNLTPGGRARSIEFMTKQLLRDKGIEPQTDGNWSDADWQREEQVAKRKFRRQLLKDTLRVATFGYIMQFAWNLGAYLPYLLFGDDEDEKQKMWDDVWAHTAFGSVEGLTGGDLMSQAGQMMLTGEGNPAYLSKDMPLTSDIMAAFQKLGNGQHTEALNDMINLIVQAGLGVNPQSITDVALSIMDACGDDPTLAHEATICISRILQVPQSQIDKMYFDEVGLSGDEVSKYTPAQLAERYAQFKVKRGRFFSPWSWGDEERIKKFTDKANKTIKERTEQMGDDKVNEAYLQYEEVYKSVDAKVKEAKKMAKTDYVEAAQLMADAQSDPNAFATYQMFKQMDGNFNKIVKFYLGAKTSDEAALCRQAVLDYKSAMVKVLDAPDAATRAEAKGNLENVMQEFTQKYVPMQQPNR